MNKIIKTIYRIYPKEVWVLTAIIFIFVSRKTIFNVRRNVGDFSASIDSGTGLALFGIIWGALYLLRHRDMLRFAIKGMWPILLYYIIAFSSFMWAGNAMPIIFKSLESIVNILLVGGIAYYIKEDKRMMFFAILLATFIPYMDVLPHILERGFVLYHTNAYTIPAFMGFLLAWGCVKNGIFTLKEMRWIMALNLYTWITGTSTASYISGIIGGIILLSSNENGLKITRTLLTCIVVYIVFSYAEDIIYDFVSAGHSREALESGTGRDKLWTAAIKSWRENPWLGKGFIVGETALGRTGQNSAHNSFMSALTGMGIVGITAFCYFQYKWIITSFIKARTNVYASITFPAIIAVSINLNACPILGSNWSYVTDTVLMIVAATFMVFITPNKGNNKTIEELVNQDSDEDYLGNT